MLGGQDDGDMIVADLERARALWNRYRPEAGRGERVQAAELGAAR
ncbi:hypothetical protein AB4Y32_26435 [Paraburkholderia phymatum]|uniref:Uncharacterized protein n=1 Tax=Paraburkholderia phymatum TaxID=148447 RepID=A0ACC6U6W3_9BURK